MTPSRFEEAIAHARQMSVEDWTTEVGLGERWQQFLAHDDLLELPECRRGDDDEPVLRVNHHRASLARSASFPTELAP